MKAWWAAPLGVGRGAGERHAVPRAWPPPTKFRPGIWGVGQVVVPYGWLRRTAAIARGSGAQRSVCGNGCEGWVGIAAEITPKVPINPGQSLSHGLRPCQLPLHKGAFPCGGRGIGRGGGLPRRPCGPPRNDKRFLSFRGAERRGNPSFLRWTGNGPPYLGHGLRRPNSVLKFGASVKSSAPTESPINHPSQPARSEASAPAAARDGRESAQRPSQKGGTAAVTAWAALSEAESAEIAAGQIRVLPDDLRVQHGARGSEV